MKNPILILSLVSILVASGLVNIGLLPLQQSFAYISPLRLEQLLHIANNNCEYNCDDGGSHDGGGTGGGDNGGGGHDGGGTGGGDNGGGGHDGGGTGGGDNGGGGTGGGDNGGGGTGGGDNGGGGTGGGGTGGGDPDIIQDPSCISVGGNSPITDSCNNAAISNNTNSGGNIGTGNGPSGSGNRASGPSIRQGPVCMTVGGNSPITGSCVNGGTIMNINTGGTVHSNSGTAVPTNTAGTVHSNSGRAVPFNNGGTDRIPLPTFS
jgi:hypothetical protein